MSLTQGGCVRVIVTLLHRLSSTPFFDDMSLWVDLWHSFHHSVWASFAKSLTHFCHFATITPHFNHHIPGQVLLALGYLMKFSPSSGKGSCVFLIDPVFIPEFKNGAGFAISLMVFLPICHNHTSFSVNIKDGGARINYLIFKAKQKWEQCPTQRRFSLQCCTRHGDLQRRAPERPG